MPTTRARTLMFGGLLIAAAIALGAGDALGVIVEGTGGVDSVTVSASGGVAKVSGLAAEVAVLHPDHAFDRLDIATLGGDDTVDNQLPAGVIQLYVDGTPQP